MTASIHSTTAVSVLLIEDDRRAAKKIEASLRQDPLITVEGAVSHLSKAAEFLAERRVDVVLYDLMLQGVERTREIVQIKKQARGATLLVLTAYEEVDRIFRALCSGADGYLFKSDTSRPLAAALRDVVAYGTTFSPAVALTIARHFHAIGEENRKAGFAQLSRREEEILNLLCQGFTNKEIQCRLNISVGAVKMHIGEICAKLEVENRTQAAVLFRLRPTWLFKK